MPSSSHARTSARPASVSPPLGSADAVGERVRPAPREAERAQPERVQRGQQLEAGRSRMERPASDVLDRARDGDPRRALDVPDPARVLLRRSPLLRHPAQPRHRAQHPLGAAADAGRARASSSGVRYQEEPERYEYRLTETGRDLYPAIVAIMRWGDEHLRGDDGPPRACCATPCGHVAEPVIGLRALPRAARPARGHARARGRRGAGRGASVVLQT